MAVVNRFQKKKPPIAALKNRVKELRMVRAADIVGAPFNFRTHPEAQQEALVACLEEIGFTSPLLVFEPEGLEAGQVMLFDGHARQELISDRIGPDTLVPCVVTDLDEGEAKRALLTHDPVGDMAEADKKKLDALLREMQTESMPLANMLEDLAKEAGCKWAEESKKEKAAGEEEEERESAYKEQYGVILLCKSEEEQKTVFELMVEEGYECRVVTT